LSSEASNGSSLTETWVRETREHREEYKRKQETLSIKAIAAQKAANKQVFNPLAPPSVIEKDPEAMREKEMRELVKQDVDRTCQEFAYFRKQSTKDALTQILYLWGK